MDLYISNYGESATYIDQSHVLKYPNGNVFVNLEGVHKTNGLIEGTDYITVDEKVWYSTEVLADSMSVTVNSTEVRLSIKGPYRLEIILIVGMLTRHYPVNVLRIATTR